MTIVFDTSTEPARAFRQKWTALTLSSQFALAGGLVMLIGMIIVGVWVSRQIEQGVIRNSGISTALYVDSFISPLAQELANSKTLSIGPISALDEAFLESPLSKRLVTVKIWKKGGVIAYSTNYNLIGKIFTPTQELKAAWKGEVAVSYDGLGDDEDAGERAQGIPLMEIYSPVRAPWTGEIIAVAEFYEDATDFKASIASARSKSALVFIGITFAMALMLMGIVHRGSKTIEEQRKTLRLQLSEATLASEQNRQLKERVQRASERVAELNEQYLNRTGAELHDGPAQLLALASLRIDTLRNQPSSAKRKAEIDIIKKALDDAMSDIRDLCRGLTLPDIAELSVQEIIQRVANAHEERSNTKVSIKIDDINIPISHSVKICVYRFVQEALNNSWHHAEGCDQRVICTYERSTRKLSLSVSDGGKGIATSNKEKKRGGLGLIGMRQRIEAIGGELQIDSKIGKGTLLTMQVLVNQE